MVGLLLTAGVVVVVGLVLYKVVGKDKVEAVAKDVATEVKTEATKVVDEVEKKL
jgi:hypothetical protein